MCRSERTMEQRLGQDSLVNKRVSTYFLPLSRQVEKLLLIGIACSFVGLFLTQWFILTNEDYQSLVNKTIRYEGVFQEDHIQSKATLQRR